MISDANVNLALVEAGQAFVDRRHLGSCDARRYLDAEESAGRQRLGVWTLPGGLTRPWDFRHGRR